MARINCPVCERLVKAFEGIQHVGETDRTYSRGPLRNEDDVSISATFYADVISQCETWCEHLRDYTSDPYAHVAPCPDWIQQLLAIAGRTDPVRVAAALLGTTEKAVRDGLAGSD
jgi:hypothetical protein